MLYTHTHVREDTLGLFGFKTQDELRFFKLLIGVSGVGPKTAILVINNGVERITQAIEKSDVSFFTSIPRLGKKNAQKIIIELKSKIGDSKDLDLISDDDKETHELVEVLKSFGFSKKEAQLAIRNIPGSTTKFEDRVRTALKLLGR